MADPAARLVPRGGVRAAGRRAPRLERVRRREAHDADRRHPGVGLRASSRSRSPGGRGRTHVDGRAGAAVAHGEPGAACECLAGRHDRDGDGLPEPGARWRAAGRADHGERQDRRAPLTAHPGGGGWLAWLEASGLGVAMRQWLWLYPIVEIVHIAGIVVLVGAAAMFDLRLLGLSRRLPVSAMAAHLLPWARAGLAIVVPTGAMMFVAHATEMAGNPAFRLKLALIAAALINAGDRKSTRLNS